MELEFCEVQEVKIFFIGLTGPLSCQASNFFVFLDF